MSTKCSQIISYVTKHIFWVETVCDMVVAVGSLSPIVAISKGGSTGGGGGGVDHYKVSKVQQM